MVRTIPRHLRLISAALLSFVCPIYLLPPVAAQAGPAIAGTALDEAGAVLPGARVTVTDASGRLVRTTVTNGAGAFAIETLSPGTYTVVVELPLFAAASESVTVPVSGVAPTVRAVLEAGGFSERVVVSARRVETRVAETPQKIEIIDAVDIERTVAADLTDVLKKASGVDVIQYSGVLSGIGIRGFRPQFSGINKRSLLLIDGRPSGVTNLATLQLDNVERIEVLKGAASSVYGSSAMGGVVNVITRQSRGKLAGTARLGGGSFGTSELSGRVGGSASSRVDVDLGGNAFDQRDDYRMGNGEVRPATSYKTYDGSARLGVDLGTWRLEARANGYRGRDIMTPGNLVTGVSSQGRKDLERSSQDARVTGLVGGHALSITGYHTDESSHTFNVTTTNPLDQPYLPYLSFENDLGWVGLQLRDTWNWSRQNNVVVGFDYEKVTSVSRSYLRTGDRSAPFSADNNKRTAGFYGENTLRLRDGRTVVTLGGRVDRIATETVDTPLKTNFTPSESSFTVFNPSFGIKHQILNDLRAHFAVGRAFIPAEAVMLTGYTTTIVGGRTQISQGNPDLKPERSTSFDIGAEWTAQSSRLDVTFFRTVVKDRFISNVVISNPPPPDPIVLSVTNGLDAHISGLEVDVNHRLRSRVGVFANTTHYLTRKERLTSGLQQDILNVPMHTIRAGIDLDFGALSSRVSGRFVQGRKDNDFNQAGFPIIDYDDFTVIDANVTYRLTRLHSLVLVVNNVFDELYYEKLGFPLQGASFKAFYRLGF
ncbi:MAG: TonB-dependent receptor [Luteitalea sp.]|nr:TonB-dependent receptor [Luteitalea sp.]